VVWLLGIYLIHAVVPHKTVRQDVGILLPVSIVSAAGVCSLSGLRRKFVIGLVLLVGVLQLSWFTLPLSSLGGLDSLEWAYQHAEYDCGAWPPRREDWRIEEVLSTLGAGEIKVGVLSDHVSINGRTFEWYVHRMGLPFRVVQCRARTDDFVKKLSTYDFVITKSDWEPELIEELGLPWGQADLVVLKHFEDNLDSFALCRSVRLPDGSDMLVYGRVSEKAACASRAESAAQISRHRFQPTGYSMLSG